MKYYVVSDTHGFYDETITSLTEKGFFNDLSPHKLIICGDLMDRSNQATKMQDFAYDLLQKGQLIFIRGNHEDLMLEMLDDFEENIWSITTGMSHHVSNGTFSTAQQLSNMDLADILDNPKRFVRKVQNSIFCKELIPASLNYFETENYVFVHSRIPVMEDNLDWRNADKSEWYRARWGNPFSAAIKGAVPENKTLVFGHWHTSYYNSNDHEFDDQSDFSIAYGKRFIGLDGCTAFTKKVNCLVIEETD